MASQSRFIIHNEMGKPLILNIEPEGSFFPLDVGHEVAVTDRYTSAPVTLTITDGGGGDPILSIWPGDGEVTVEKDGVDVLDLAGSIHGPLGSQA